jgi:hypothetical protein
VAISRERLCVSLGSGPVAFQLADGLENPSRIHPQLPCWHKCARTNADSAQPQPQHCRQLAYLQNQTFIEKKQELS